MTPPPARRPTTRPEPCAAPASAGGADVELGEEDADAALDLVPDRAHRVNAPAVRVVKLPVLVALAGIERAGIAAAHGDDDVGGPHRLLGPRLGVLPGDVDADLGHGLHGHGVHRRAGL